MPTDKPKPVDKLPDSKPTSAPAKDLSAAPNTIALHCPINPSEIAQAQAQYLLKQLAKKSGTSELETDTKTGNLILKDHNQKRCEFKFDKSVNPNQMTAIFYPPFDPKFMDAAAIFQSNERLNERYKQDPIITAGLKVDPAILEQTKQHFAEQNTNKDLEKKWTLMGLAIGHENRMFTQTPIPEEKKPTTPGPTESTPSQKTSSGAA